MGKLKMQLIHNKNIRNISGCDLYEGSVIYSLGDQQTHVYHIKGKDFRKTKKKENI